MSGGATLALRGRYVGGEMDSEITGWGVAEGVGATREDKRSIVVFLKTQGGFQGD